MANLYPSEMHLRLKLRLQEQLGMFARLVEQD